MSRQRVLSCGAWILITAAASFAHAVAISWDGGAVPAGLDGSFQLAANWDPNQIPVAGDTVTIDNPTLDIFTVTFASSAFSDSLTVTGLAPINLRSQDATVRSYNVTSGAADLTIDAGLNVGGTGVPLVLAVGDALDIGTNSLASVTVRGAGSQLIVLGSGNHDIGLNGNSGSLMYEISASGTIAGTLDLGVSTVATTTGTLTVQTGADLDVANLNIGTGATSAANGTVTVTGAGSTLDMTGTSALTIGSAAGNIGTLNVNSSGVFNTATTGTTIVNATGDINIGGGTLNLNANTTVNGGAITRSSGTLTFASGKTYTAQSNAQVDLGGTITLSGVSGGTTWNINSGADVFGSNDIDIGTSASTTNVTIDGIGSSLATGTTSAWGTAGNTANVTIQNNATTNLAGIDLANSSTVGTTGTITVQTGADMNVGNLNIANPGGTGTVTVTGVGATITQSGTSGLTVGNSSTGSATINIDSSGVFNTAVGGTATINATGDINIGGGTLNLRGNTIVDGGTITRTSGNLALDSGRTLTANNSAKIDVGGVTTLSGGTTWNVNGGSALTGSNAINIGTTGGTTAVTVDGTGSSLVTAATSAWGQGGHTANVTIRNDATADLASIVLAGSTTAGTTGILNVESGAEVTVGTLNIASNGGATTTGTITVTGTGSTLTQDLGSTLLVGHASTGNATINVNSGGIFNTGTGAVTINATGDVNMSGGASRFNLNGNTTVNGGTVNVTGGLVNLATGLTLTAQNGAQLNFASVVLDNGTTWNINSGADLTSSSFVDIGFSGSATVTVDGSGTTLQADAQSFWGSNGSIANVTFINGASGDISVLRLAGDSTAGSTANVDVLSGASLTVFDLFMAAFGGATSATLDVQGSGSALNIGSGTVGHTSSGTAVINVGTTTSGASFNTTTPTGTFVINPTGTVNIGNGANTGTFSAGGNVTVDGGTLSRGAGSTFSLTTGKTMTIQNGGAASFTGNYTTASSAIYNVSGAGSILATASTGNTLTIAGGTTVNVTSQGTISAGGSLDIISGTLIVDGVGSSADAGSSGLWGFGGGNTANVTLSNGATCNFGPFSLLLANSFAANVTTNVSVLSGADLTSGSMSLATTGGTNNSATLTIDGAGSVVMPGSSLTIGHASAGSAVVNVLNDGALTVGASGTTINATGTINIDGGAVDLKTLTDNGGSINFLAGSLGYLGNLTVGAGGLLGDNVNLTPDHQLTLSGTTTIDASHALTLSGGTLNTGSMLLNGAFNFEAGTLNMTAAGGSLNGLFSSDPDTTININANNVSLGNSFFFGAFNHQGTLNVGANTISLLSLGYARLGVVTSLSGGTINATNGVTFGSCSNFVGNGAVNARVAAELGSVISATGPLALGNAASPAGFVSNGELRTSLFAITLNSSAQATLGNLTTLGSGASPGTLNASNGLIVDFGRSITGFGTINSTNTLAKRTIINGVAQGNSAAQPLTFTGYVKGVGTFDNVTFAGTFDPGLSPTLLTVGSLAFSPANTLIMELGGTTAGGQFDAIHARGQLDLDGTLQVALINGFSPSSGNSFEVLHADGGIFGAFADELLPALAAGLGWNVIYSNFSVLLQVAPVLVGDYNQNGAVDAADYIVWRKTLGSTTNLAADGNGNNQIDAGDYGVWRAHFGQTAGSGAAQPSADQLSATVPEPTTLVPLLAAAGWCFPRRRTMRRVPTTHTRLR